MPISGKLTKVTSSKTHQYIWCVENGKYHADINIYHPEDDGYQVLSIDLGELNVLVPIALFSIPCRCYATVIICQRCIFQFCGACFEVP